MKKSEIVKKYTSLFGKRPTLNINKDITVSSDELFKMKQENKINQFLWTLKKEIFIEYIEKSVETDETKFISAKQLVESFKKNDLMKIYHGYQFKLNIETKTYSLFHD